MEVISLHPFDPAVAERYIAALTGKDTPVPGWSAWWSDVLPRAVEQARGGDETASNRISLGLAWALAGDQPSYLIPGFGLSIWEARIDRAVGMMLRPPSRLFQDAGMDPAPSRTMPIRLDLQQGMMGGAYVPARLIPRVHELLETQFDRTVRRLVEAEYDPLAILGSIFEAVEYAHAQGLGLYEAMDAFGPDGQSMPGMGVVIADPKRADRTLLQRIELAQRKPKKSGFLARLLGRGTDTQEIMMNGHSRKE